MTLKFEPLIPSRASNNEWIIRDRYGAEIERRSDHCANTQPTIEPKETHR